MDRRGEVEIAINKRTLERAGFLLIIIVLGVLLFLRGGNDSSGDVEANANLSTALAASQASVASLEHELELTKEELAEAKAEAAIASAKAVAAPEEPVAKKSLSGEIAYSWKVDGTLQTPADYNAVAIKKLQDEIADLEEELDDANGTEQGPIEDDIEEREDKIDDLMIGENRYKLNAVSITIDNQREGDGVFDYVVCWAGYDCTKTKSSGSINVPSGEKLTEDVKLTIPTILQMNKDQILRLLITRDGKDVFSDQELIKENDFPA